MDKSGLHQALLIQVEAKELEIKLFLNKIDKTLKMKLIYYILNL